MNAETVPVPQGGARGAGSCASRAEHVEQATAFSRAWDVFFLTAAVPFGLENGKGRPVIFA